MNPDPQQDPIGKVWNMMEDFIGQCIVVKVGTSTLTYENGKLNIRRIEQLARVLSDLQNAGNRMVLVSSGAIGVGVGKLGLTERPRELMFMYDKMFGEYNHTVAQVLLTRDVVENEHSKQNVVNTLHTLLSMGIIPVVNENDTVAIDELVGANFGDNDTLSAIVAHLAEAQKLIILTDIDGLYDSDPRKNPDAKRIPEVRKVTPEIVALAGGSGSARGTGGMLTKVHAAQMANQNGIDVIIIRGDQPKLLYDAVAGLPVGTRFCRQTNDAEH